MDYFDMKDMLMDELNKIKISQTRLFAETFKHCVKSKSRKSIKLEKEG